MSELDKFLERTKQDSIDKMIEIVNLKANLKDCVNELCLKCGQYKTQHLGSCDDCRWKTVKEGFR